MLLFALVAHEFAHGWAAYRQGDDTAYKLGRLTLNPIPHIDPVLTILMPVMLWFMSHGTFTFGGARPVPVVTRNFRNFRRGDLIVSGAGIATNLVLAVAFSALFAIVGEVHILAGRIGTSMIDTMQRMLFFGIEINLILAFFNLIPIPPLDGSHVLKHVLPPSWSWQYQKLGRYGLLVLIALLWWGRPVLNAWMSPAFALAGFALRAVAPFVLVSPWT